VRFGITLPILQCQRVSNLLLTCVVRLQYFAVHGVEIEMLPLPTWEANKDFQLVYEVARQLEDFGINRLAGILLSILYSNLLS